MTYLKLANNLKGVAILLSFVSLWHKPFQLWGATHLADDKLWSSVVTIDSLVWKGREGEKKINDIAKDNIFARRLYLDICGRIPTSAELDDFMKDKHPAKRSILIDTLLSSNEYIYHYSTMWAEMLRIPGKGLKDNYNQEYIHWVWERLYQNAKYDDMVYELVTNIGDVRNSPAANFYARDELTGILDTVNATTRTFLGTRIGCAQCHNHRFDKWTQKQFYQFSAIMNKVVNKHPDKKVGFFMARFHYKLIEEVLPLNHWDRMVFVPSFKGAVYNEKRTLTFPENYRYDNARPGDKVDSEIIFDFGNPKDKSGDNELIRMAKWLTGKDNHQFASMMANRLWKKNCGVAFLEPLDDWKESMVFKNPDLWKALGDIFIKVDYDIKAFLSVLYNTEAYQLAVHERHEVKVDSYKAQGAIMRRMSAEQLYDSILALQHGDLSQHNKFSDDYFAFRREMFDLSDQFIDDLKAIWEKDGRVKDARTNIQPGLVELMKEKYKPRIKKIVEDYGYSYSENKSKSVRYGASNMMMQAQNIKNMSSKNSENMMSYNKKRRKARPVLRAVNIRDSKFLSTFGATDRQTTKVDSNRDADIQQILLLLNDRHVSKVCLESSYLMRAISKEKSVKEQISVAYTSIYAREPTLKELKFGLNFFKDPIDKQAPWTDYLIAMINSPEFYFIQ
jgi:hypothetical protein